MNSRLNFLAFAACCAALSGCDWGGVSDSENWNEGYAWLNFTGTYLLQNAIDVTTTSTTTSDIFSDSTDPASSSSTSEAKTETYTESKSGHTSGSIPYTGTTWGATLSPVGTDGIEPGSVQVTVTGSKTVTFSDDGNGNLNGSIQGSHGSVTYKTGAISINTGSTLGGKSKSNASVDVRYNYSNTTTKQIEGVATKTDAERRQGTVVSQKSSLAETPIVYLNVNQKGNVFTMKDSNGVTYSGRITGVSCARDSYKVAGDKTLSFEVSSGNAKIVGSFTGTTSAANSESTVVVSNRRINGTYRNGKNSANFTGSAR